MRAVFRSSRRDVVYPQAEHARLAATLALAWGNRRFARPPLPFEPFVSGVALHDRGYGELDTDGIGEVPVERWLEIQRSSFRPRGRDAVVDLVVALHVHRLTAAGRRPAETDASEEMAARLDALHAAAGVAPPDATEADAITNLCDHVAFDFCFEEPAGGSVEVAPRRGAARVAVQYEVDGRGSIVLDPWPLDPPRLSGIAVAYRAEGYPGVLEPSVVQFHVVPA